MCSCPPRPDRPSGWPWATACGLGRRCWRSTPSEAIPPPQHAARRDRRTEPVHAVQSLLRHLVHGAGVARSEEHTSELQSRFDLVCRLLLEKKKKKLL